MADKYFPNQNPVGKTLIFNDNPKMSIKKPFFLRKGFK